MKPTPVDLTTKDAEMRRLEALQRYKEEMLEKIKKEDLASRR